MLKPGEKLTTDLATAPRKALGTGYTDFIAWIAGHLSPLFFSNRERTAIDDLRGDRSLFEEETQSDIVNYVHRN
jgi:hypothetical protein